MIVDFVSETARQFHINSLSHLFTRSDSVITEKKTEFTICELAKSILESCI